MAFHETRASNLPENVLPPKNITINEYTEFDPLNSCDYFDEYPGKSFKKKMKKERRKQRRELRRHKNDQGGETNYRTDLTLEPRTQNQKEYLHYLDDPNTHVVFGIGPAGTGKTYLATKWAGISLLEDRFDKIVITRPAVSVSEKLGFLPGGIREKMDPWLLPIIDVLIEVLGKTRFESFIKFGKIEIAPLAFMRGRTFKNAVVLLDEAQNSTPDQTKTFLTRIGEGSKMIITGDIYQSDYKDKNGLVDFMTRFVATDGIELVEFNKTDIVRHHLIGDILKMYGE